MAKNKTVLELIDNELMRLYELSKVSGLTFTDIKSLEVLLKSKAMLEGEAKEPEETVISLSNDDITHLLNPTTDVPEIKAKKKRGNSK